MTNRELKQLNRHDLLELLIQQEQQNEALQARVTELEALLDSRAIEINNAGTLAEAALSLNGVLEAADKAAAQYLENIKRCSEQQESIYNRIVADAQNKAQSILSQAEQESRRKTEAADAYWQKLSGKLEDFYQTHTGLKELLSIQTNKKQS